MKKILALMLALLLGLGAIACSPMEKETSPRRESQMAEKLTKPAGTQEGSAQPAGSQGESLQVPALTEEVLPPKTEPVVFTVGTCENGLYQNPWAKLSCQLPEGWVDETLAKSMSLNTQTVTYGLAASREEPDQSLYIYFETGHNYSPQLYLETLVGELSSFYASSVLEAQFSPITDYSLAQRSFKTVAITVTGQSGAGPVNTTQVYFADQQGDYTVVIVISGQTSAQVKTVVDGIRAL